MVGCHFNLAPQIHSLPCRWRAQWGDVWQVLAQCGADTNGLHVSMCLTKQINHKLWITPSKPQTHIQTEVCVWMWPCLTALNLELWQSSFSNKTWISPPIGSNPLASHRYERHTHVSCMFRLETPNAWQSSLMDGQTWFVDLLVFLIHCPFSFINSFWFENSQLIKVCLLFFKHTIRLVMEGQRSCVWIFTAVH